MTADDGPMGHDRLHGQVAPVPAEWLADGSPVAAPAVLGLLLERRLDGQRVLARIVEAEAYHERDPASHSNRGRTPRTEPMFSKPGTAYVYRSYGVHWCLNVTVDAPGTGSAVLVRAAVVLDGIEVVRARRMNVRAEHELLRGPGRLTKGLEITAPEHDGGDLLAGVNGLRLLRDEWRPWPRIVAVGPRTGVTRAASSALRFHLRGAREVSPYRRSPRAPIPVSSSGEEGSRARPGDLGTSR